MRQVKLTAFMVSAFIAGVCGALYAYNFGTVSANLFGTVNSLVIIAYAYFGGITMITGALFAGVGATQGLIPQAFQTWWGLSGNWALLIGAVGLLVTLVGNPDGIAGTAYWKRRAKAKAKALAAAGGNAAAVVDMPAPREAASAPSSATRTVDKQLPVPVEKPGGTGVVPREVLPGCGPGTVAVFATGRATRCTTWYRPD